MIDLEKLKPILKDIIPEDSMSDAVIRIQEIDEEMDDSSLQNALAENERLKEQNRKLTDIFFTGKKEEFDGANLPDEPAEGDDEGEGSVETFADLFEDNEYKKGETKLNG